MVKPIIRLLAFFGKELNEIRRQPRLVLSLMLGPLLVLLLFGVGYQGTARTFRTALVIPPEFKDNPQIEPLRQAMTTNTSFQPVTTIYDEAEAMRMLERGEVDVVEVLPANVEQQTLSGKQSPIKLYYNEISRMDEQWILYLSYVQVSELNDAVLRSATRNMQDDAKEMQTQLSQVRAQLDTLDAGLSGTKKEEVRASLQRLKDLSGVLALSPLLASQAGDAKQTRAELERLRQDIDAVDAAVAGDTIAQQQERVRQMRDRVAQLEQTIGQLSSVSPTVLVSPLILEGKNTRSEGALELMPFYAPSVLALILQHIAVTLGSLSLVREKLLGALELFSVAPVSMLQVLVGKYLAYTIFIAVISALLVASMVFGLEIPFLGPILAFAGLTVLFVLASLGLGFLLSSLSTSDSQAVQLSMLTLLLSIFFSGFFLPLEQFWEPLRGVGYALPITHAIAGYQDIMLRGSWPDPFNWSMLGVLAGVTFLLTTLIWGRQFRRIT